MKAAKYETLAECLQHFQQTFNNHSMVKKLIKEWNRSIVVEANDSPAIATMIIQNLQVTDVKEGAHPSEDFPIHLQGTEMALIRIFSGDLNPAHALIDGDLAVFSSEKDKVKLEAITMVIWGL